MGKDETEPSVGALRVIAEPAPNQDTVEILKGLKGGFPCSINIGLKKQSGQEQEAAAMNADTSSRSCRHGEHFASNDPSPADRRKDLKRHIIRMKDGLGLLENHLAQRARARIPITAGTYAKSRVMPVLARN